MGLNRNDFPFGDSIAALFDTKLLPPPAECDAGEGKKVVEHFPQSYCYT